MPHDIPSSVFLVILLIRASCRIRTNDPEITNHVLWPTELKRRGGQAIPIAPLQPSALATFPSWGDSKGAGRKRLARLLLYHCC